VAAIRALLPQGEKREWPFDFSDKGGENDRFPPNIPTLNS
jgi:hypothetical protein